MLERVWGSSSSHSLLAGCKMVQPVWKAIWQAFTKLNVLFVIEQCAPWCVPKLVEH